MQAFPRALGGGPGEPAVCLGPACLEGHLHEAVNLEAMDAQPATFASVGFAKPVKRAVQVRTIPDMSGQAQFSRLTDKLQKRRTHPWLQGDQLLPNGGLPLRS